MAQTPFKLDLVLNFPPDAGEPAVDRPASLSSTFQHKSEVDLVLTGSGSKVISFGSLTAAGAKGILVEVAQAAAGAVKAPIMVQINAGGATAQVEVSQGGFWALASPEPTASGVLQMTIVHTQNAEVAVRILG